MLSYKVFSRKRNVKLCEKIIVFSSRIDQEKAIIVAVETITTPRLTNLSLNFMLQDCHRVQASVHTGTDYLLVYCSEANDER